LKRHFYNYSLAIILCMVSLEGGAETTASDWPLCPATIPVPERPRVDVPLAPGEVHIVADDADIEKEGVSTLIGNVEITRDNQQVSADTIIYNQPAETADMQGQVEYWDDGMYLFSENGRIDFSTDSGSFNNSRYFLMDNRARGEADQIDHDYPDLSTLLGVDYTTCEPDNNFWKLSASTITLNHDEKWGSARNVVLRVKDVPVLYTPYISFPLSKERKTGFLFPSFGSTNRSGYEVRTPFYWNIAPDMDATITPRVLSDSGLMMLGQFRYLLGRGEGEINGEYLPSDNDYNDRDRALFSFRHRQKFADTGNLFLTYNRVSDKQYFEDFGSTLRLSSTRFLERRADASYKGDWWQLRALIQDYQTVDSSISQLSLPYKRLPQVSFHAFSPFRNKQLNFELGTEIAFFDRGNNSAVVNDVNGLRYDIFPSISFPFHTASAYITPKAGVRFTQYNLQDSGPFLKSNPHRILPVLSLDSGLFFERETTLFNTSFTQTLEPRLFYLYVPDDRQRDLPVFDTGLYDFSFDALFRENRFTGPDRMGDANQVTLAVTSRFLDHASGREAGYVSLGQVFYFDNRDVFLTIPGLATTFTGKVRKEDSSPIVAEIGTSIIDNWHFRGSLQWDPNNNKTEKMVAFAQYNPAPDKVINLGYRVRHTTDSLSSPFGGAALTNLEQSEISFHWPLTHNWSIVGRWNHAVPENRVLEAFGGIEYENCCWAFRTVARRFLTDVDRDYNTGIFFQIELKGLAGIGQQTAEFLQESIPGYKSDF